MEEKQNNPAVVPAFPPVRQGWAEQFELMAELGDDQLLDDVLITSWDEEE